MLCCVLGNGSVHEFLGRQLPGVLYASPGGSWSFFGSSSCY